MDTNNPANENVKQAVPFFGVSNIEGSVQFYADGLGFQMTYKWEHEGKLSWCWLQRGGAAIMLQEFWKEGHHANVLVEKLGVGVSVCFICEDALAFYKEVISRGLNASEPFVGNNMWVTGLTDPDGYNIFFESYTTVAEDTTYAQWNESQQLG